MVFTAEEAADALAGQGIEAEIIDLRTLSPLDMDSVSASVKKTGRAVVVTESHRTAGMSAEIAARITEANWDDLAAPVERVAAKDVPIPATRLEKLSIPSVEEIVEAAKRLHSA